jgi:hypothetical protein
MRRWKIGMIVISVLVSVSALSSVYAQDEECIENECTVVAEAQPSYGLTEDVILAFDSPDLRQLNVDTNLLRDRRYMRVSGSATIHDAPNGNVIRTLDAGFNFVTAIGEQDGWIQINSNEWISATHLSDVNYAISQFTGVFMPADPLEYRMAWLLVNAYPSDEPGGVPNETKDLIWRYTRVFIYATETVDGFDWYQIGPNQWVHQYNVAKIQPIERPEDVTTTRWVGVDLYEQTLIVYDGDQPVFATLVSTGLPRWQTYEGVFNIYYRRTREHMSWGTPGDDFYALEEVPWTMYFDDGRALHGEYWHDGLGYRRSHGCVNISITDAHWLYNWVAEEFDKLNSPDVEVGPAVYVYSSGEFE